MSAHSHIQIAGRLFDEATAKELRSLAASARCEPAQVVRAIEAVASPARLLAKVENISEDRAEAIISAIKAADAKKKPKAPSAPVQARQQAETSRQAREIIARKEAERKAAASPAPRSNSKYGAPTAASKSAMIKDIIAKQAQHVRR